MVSRGFTSREFAGRSPFAIKFPNPSHTMHVLRLFLFKAFQPLLVIYLHTVVETLILRSWIFFLPFCLVKLLRRHILTAFSITFLTHLKKDGFTLLGLSSKVFTFDHLFTYIVHTLVNSLTISLPVWPEILKSRSLSFSANSVGLHFRERVEKIKENGKKTVENLQNGRENMAGKNSRTCTFGPKLQKYYNFFKF